MTRISRRTLLRWSRQSRWVSLLYAPRRRWRQGLYISTLWIHPLTCRGYTHVLLRENPPRRFIRRYLTLSRISRDICSLWWCEGHRDEEIKNQPPTRRWWRGRGVEIQLFSFSFTSSVTSITKMFAGGSMKRIIPYSDVSIISLTCSSGESWFPFGTKRAVSLLNASMIFQSPSDSLRTGNQFLKSEWALYDSRTIVADYFRLPHTLSLVKFRVDFLGFSV